MEEVSQNSRITFRSARPNPLFQAWLQELYDEAKEKGSRLEGMLLEALTSLSKYPLPLNSGMECGILKGFGKKLCTFLDQRLEVYNSNHLSINQESSETSQDSDSTQPKSPRKRTRNKSVPKSKRKKSDIPTTKAETLNADVVPVSTNDCDVPLQPAVAAAKSPKRRKEFKPAHRSGGYAILIALLNNVNESNVSSAALNKEQLIEKAQPFSEESFTRPKPDSFYTAWSNMSRLITKGLVCKSRTKKPEFSLTNSGLELATKLLNETSIIPSVNDLIFNAETYSPNNNPTTADKPVDRIDADEDNNNIDDLIEFTPGSFEVILLIDKNETSGCSKKNDPTVTQFKKYPDLKHEYRHLKVGDFTWVAQSKTNSNLELVLPFVVERKRMDDLGHSVKDGRFHEQKFRLRKSGIKNVIYLVENFGGNKHIGLPLPSLMQALANTRIHDGFKIHFTDSLTNTARFLAMMTKRLSLEYKERTIQGWDSESKGVILMTFSYFNKSSAKSKTLTVTETFIKILLQLRGMSVEKALAITKTYKTPKALMEKYKMCSQKEGETLLTYLKHGDRNVGPTVSKAVYQLFSNEHLQ